MQIIPGVLAKTLKELKEQLHLLSWAKKVHIDIMDGKFAPNKTISALTLKKALPKMEMQIHYMGYKPHRQIAKFARMGAEDFIIHAEATDKAAETLEMIREKGMKSGIAFNPETHIESHKDTLVHADLALVMTVHPGFSGQAFIKKPLHKIQQIHKHNPLIAIGVDGGVNHTTCKLASKAHAQFAIATSAVTKADEPKQAFQKLTRLCK